MNTKVKVVAGNRGKFVLRWKDASGVTRQRSTEFDSRPSNRKHAYRLASELERELEGISPPFLMLSKRDRQQDKLSNRFPAKPEELTGDWNQYESHFIETHLSALSDSYQSSMLPIISRFKRFASPRSVQDVTPSVVRRWIAELRNEGLAPASIRSYWRNLSAFLAIAVSDGIIDRVPTVRLPRGKQKMKGRALIGEEIERLKAAVESTRPKPQWVAWKWAIDALNLSGLRISEAYRITWEPSPFWIEMGRHPTYVIEGEQKSGQHQRLPIVPDFAQVLKAIPERDQIGRVFSFPGRSGELSFQQTKNVIASLGKKAGIRTRGKKTATAHDLRRSFGNRWALKVMPQVLQKLMRHQEISTTMRYYAHLDSDQILEALVGDQMGDQNNQDAKEQVVKKSSSHAKTRSTGERT